MDKIAKKSLFSVNILPLVVAVVTMQALLTGCNNENNYFSVRVDGQKAMEHVKKQVAFGSRPSGSEALVKCRDYIAGEIKKLGVEVEVDSWSEFTDDGRKAFHNVYARIPGKDDKKRILIGSHYDTKLLEDIPSFQGANDAGSSTGLLIEMIRLFKESNWQGCTLEFAFFDGEECVHRYGEEDGLHGSKRLANKIKNRGEVDKYEAMILLDMIGDKDLTVTFTEGMDDKLITMARKIADKQGVGKNFIFAWTLGSILDDHVPFRDIGIPAIDFIDFRYGPENSYWHTKEDSLDKISPESMAIVGDVAMKMISELGTTKKD